MYKQKTYNGSLNIDKEKVSIDSNFLYKSLTIYYVGDLKIKSLMPKGFTVFNNKKTKTLTILSGYNYAISSMDLFAYFGNATLYKCIANEGVGFYSVNLYINKLHLELWNTLSKRESLDSDEKKTQDWAYITKNWEDINFNRKNNKKSYLYNKTSYNKETNQYTTIKEIRKK